MLPILRGVPRTLGKAIGICAGAARSKGNRDEGEKKQAKAGSLRFQD